MRSDAFIRVTCDNCTSYHTEVQLTALSRNEWDERYVAAALKREGWTIQDGKELCENCSPAKPAGTDK